MADEMGLGKTLQWYGTPDISLLVQEGCMLIFYMIRQYRPYVDTTEAVASTQEEDDRKVHYRLPVQSGQELG